MPVSGKVVPGAPKQHVGFKPRSVPQHAEWQFSIPRFLGFANPGIDCFMNAALQVILRLPQAASIPEDIAGLPPNATATALVSVMYHIAVPTPETVVRSSTVSYIIAPVFKALRDSLVGVFDFMSTDRQQDSAEFVEILLEKLEGTRFNKACTFVTQYELLHLPKHDEEYLPPRLITGDTPKILHASFNSAYVGKYQESDANGRRLLDDTVQFDLAAMIESESDLVDLRDDLGVSNRYLKLPKIATTPDILIIQIKRFNMDNTVGTLFKYTNFVNVPLSGLKFGDRMYRLHGVINHHGGFGAGHYTSAVVVNREWTDYNDSRATATQADRVITRDAYIAIYVPE